MHWNKALMALLLLGVWSSAGAQEAVPTAAPAADEESVPGEDSTAATGDGDETTAGGEEQVAGTSPDTPRTMSGMSILGNEEAPKSLVIVPWKSSRLGDDPSLTDSLDDRARPVDREVFERELRYYGIRAGDGPRDDS
jgi:hypothetical protein